jgi:ABC-type transport system involved in Fe-S cluster assembly fused permease/ATPase subunit
MATDHHLALQVLHYVVPLIVILYWVLARTVVTIFLHKPSKNAGAATRKYAAIGLLFTTCATAVGQALTYFAQSFLQPGTYAPQHAVINILLSLLVYGSLMIGVIETSMPVWHPYLGSCVLGAALETTVTVLQALSKNGADTNFAFTRLALQVAKSMALVVFCLSTGWWALNDRTYSKGATEEAAPLLSNGNTNDTHKSDYGSVPDQDDDNDDDSDLDGMDSDYDDDPEETKKLKGQQRKRLQEKGGWIGYLKEFKIFIPMLWPTKDRFVQTCLGLVGFVIVSRRFLNVLVPRQLGLITDELATGHGNGEFPWRTVGIWMGLSYLQSSAGVSLIKSLAEVPVQQFGFKAIGAKSFEKVMGLSMDFHNEKDCGELIRAIDQGRNLQDLLEFMLFQVAPIFVDLTIAMVYVYILFDVYMSCVLGFVAVAYIYVGTKTNAMGVKHRRRFNTSWRNESKVQTEAVINWQTVSHFNRASYECERYNKSIDELNAAEIKYFRVYILGGAAQSLVMITGRLAASFLAIYRVSQGEAPVGNFITLITYWSSIESPLAQISWSIRRITQMLTDSERLLQLFQTVPSVQDAPNATDIQMKGGEVSFDRVAFSYDVRKSTLKDMSFTAKPGQTVALVGETGGGKSTVLKLLYRYYDVTGGRILIDGQDIRDVKLDSLREIFGMVPQDPALFNTTIMDNVRYARLDATDDEVKDACRAAAIHDKIESFPDKYKSKVGERGVKLSGGELQRVSIARAILRQPKIVLLDEATSMVDAETEATIQHAFKRLAAGRTTFVIAHRLSTIQHADLILVVNDGEIIERGTHEELFRMKGKYVALWSKQLSKDVVLQVDKDHPELVDVTF